jgi:hypothetical protein
MIKPGKMRENQQKKAQKCMTDCQEETISQP